jgi:hypothetical protein
MILISIGKLHADLREISSAALISYRGSTSNNSKDMAPQVGCQAVAKFTSQAWQLSKYKS